MDIDFSLLKSITSKTSVEQFEKTLAFLGDPRKGVTLKTQDLVPNVKTLVLKADESEENAEADRKEAQKQQENPRVDFDLDYVTMLRAENERQGYLINLLQGKIDEAVPALKVDMDLSILDYTSAYDATVFYSKDWFANSLLSDDAKVDLATYLLTRVQQYCDSNLETLQMISEGDADMISYIRVPRDLDLEEY